MTAPIKMRVNIAGFAGSAVSVYCAFDPATDVLLIGSVAEEYQAGPREDFLKITNTGTDAAFDAVFQNDETKEAIEAYFALASMRLIVMKESAKRLTPDAKIERDGMDERGPKYRIAPDIGCGQVAVLVASLFAKKQRAHAAAAESFKEFQLIHI
jgi:hypothetical protein